MARQTALNYEIYPTMSTLKHLSQLLRTPTQHKFQKHMNTQTLSLRFMQ